MAQELTARGMYIMPSDHTYTGDVLTNASASYPMMKSIIDGMRARGLENYLIMNPWNEPGPDISVSAWVQAQKDVLTYLRKTATFNGIVVMDGSGWATLLDINAFQQVMAHDASLRGGTANVAFSTHLYPNITSLPNQLWTAAKQVPLLIGELGQENPGASPLDPQYVKNTINGFFNTGMNNGHNGLFAWIFAWCDSNNMLDDWTDPSVPYSASSPLTTFGKLWQTEYFARMPKTTTPVPTSIVQQPTKTNTAIPATATKTATPRPATNTVQPPPGVTVVAPTKTNTQIPPPGGTTLIPPPATLPAGESSFYRAINLGGKAVTIAGKAWEASTAANFSLKAGTAQACNPYGVMQPSVDTATDQMLECYAEHWNHGLTLSAVPAASYDVYLYTWQDWAQPNPGSATFSVNGVVTQANYAISSTAGQWTRLGPWRVSVTTGSLVVASSGNNLKLSGLEVWRVTSGSTAVPTTIVQQPTKTSTSIPPTATKSATPKPPTATTVPATKTTVAPTKTNVAPTKTTVPATATKVSTSVPPTKTTTPLPPPTGERTFYRGINLGGKAVTIAGNQWEAGNAANFSVRAGTPQECNPYARVSPAVEAATEQMLECFVEHWSHQLTMSAVPNAVYDVYLYTWQDWAQPKPGTATFKVNDVVTQANYAISSTAGQWTRLGPWRVAVTSGSLKLTSSGNNLKLSGLEVWRVGAPLTTVAMAPTSTARTGGTSVTTPSTAAPTGFYQAVNLNGPSLTIDGQVWDGADAANLSVTGGAEACEAATVLKPLTDSSRTEMLRCYVTGTNVTVTLSGLPAGTYAAAAYLWDQPAHYTLDIQHGQQQWFNQPNPNNGLWQQVGPWRVTVDASGILTLTSSEGAIRLAGLEVWRVDGAAATTSEAAPTFVPNDAGPATTAAIAAGQTVESDDAKLAKTGDWKAQSTGKASGGSYLYSSSATLTFTVTGNSFEVLYVEHAALGTFTISVDGVVVQTVDSRSEQTKFQSIASVTGLTDGTHTVVIAPTDGAAAIDAIRIN
jgi:hypothetical protein